MKARVLVTLKTEVLDPQGKAIRNAAEQLGHAGITDVRQGKLFEITLDARNQAEARSVLAELADKLLANPVIEDYEILDLG